MNRSVINDQQSESVIGEPVRSRAERLVVVVGFDGSASSYRALDAATLLIADRVGSMEIAYVAHPPVGAELSSQALAESLQGLDAIERELAEAIAARLTDVERRWHFQRRDGLVARELLSLADKASRDYGEGTSVIVVVGSALHALHHVIGSVPVALVRHAKYPVVVVP